MTTHKPRRITEQEAKDLYLSARALYDHMRAMRKTVLELLEHPDATDEQILSAIHKHRAAVNALREEGPPIKMALSNSIGTYRWFNMFNDLQRKFFRDYE